MLSAKFAFCRKSKIGGIPKCTDGAHEGTRQKKDVEGPLAKRGEPVKIHVRHLSVHFGGVRAAPQHFFRRKDPQKTVLRIRGDRRRIPCAPVRPRHGNAPPAELLKVYASLSTRQNISRHPGAAVRMWGAWTAADF